MEITVGPNQFFWQADKWEALYSDLSNAPVNRIVIGEVVCSKRLPFYQDRIPRTVENIIASGKEVALTSLGLVTLKRERKQTAELAEMGVEIEINDLTGLAYLPEGAAFSVGPLVNVYNESTLAWLASCGARRICLPPELPISSVATLAATGAKLGVDIEVWGHGRVPLAISGRCYHARLHGRTKDNCRFACEDDPDGLDVQTLDAQPFLAMNGVQTLSDSYSSVALQMDKLTEAGVSSIRLSPQSNGFVRLCREYRRLMDDEQTTVAFIEAISKQEPGIRLSDGFLTGKSGVEWSAVEFHG